MSAPLARVRQAMIGWVFPPTCAICDDPLEANRQLERPFLCEQCEGVLTPMGADACRVCGQSYADRPVGSSVRTQPGAPFRCANCADRELAVDFALSAYRSTGEARELMHAYKYGGQIHLARLWGALLRRVWEDPRLLEVDGWHLVPVPLHWKRMRERGFNQAREIAVEFRRRAPRGMDIRFSPWLRRTRSTVRQARLDRDERLRNLSDVFAVRGRGWEPVEGYGVLIVDDVMTTATTVSECAAVLREALEIDDLPVAAVSVLRG